MVHEEEFTYPPYDEAQDLAIEEKYKVSINESFENFLLVLNVPKVPQEKKEKLKSVLRRVFEKLQVVDIFLPEVKNEQGQIFTKGYLFLEFESAQYANAAMDSINGYPFDAKHTFKCYHFSDIEKYSSISNDLVLPEKPKIEKKEHFRSWMLDSFARDQFAVLIEDTTRIYWNSKNEQPVPVLHRQKWADSDIQWSPLGTYMVTTHRQGIALWGGPNFVKISRFSHTGVSLIDFSPNEKFLVTYSKEPYLRERDKEYNIVIWDVHSGAVLRYFEGNPTSLEWPIFKWSHDDQYFGRINSTSTGISVFQSSTMTLVDKKAIPAEGVKYFCWAPDANIISYWIPEKDNNPARVTLMEVPSKNNIRTKTLYNVQNCNFYWQNKGDYFAVKVERKSKKTSSLFGVEFFRCRAKDIPVEDIDLEDDVVGECAWEPNGNRFAVIHGAGNVTLFGLKNEKKVEKLTTLEKRPCNQIFWSPRGELMVLAGLGNNLNGSLEFWRLNKKEPTTSKDKKKEKSKEEKEKDKKEQYQMLSSTNHYMCAYVKWDPSGRFVAAYGVKLGREENGYTIYDFKGEQVSKGNNSKFTTFMWRPRPPTLLSEEKKKEIEKNLKKYSAEFEEIDLMIENKELAEIKETKKQQLSDWKDFQKKADQRFKELKAKRDKIRGFTSDNEEEVIVTEEKETIISEEKSPYS